MIDSVKQSRIDSLNTKIEKCKQSIARLNDKLANIKSNIDKKYIKPLIKIGFSEDDANNMWEMANLMDEYFKYRKYINQHFFKFVKNDLKEYNITTKSLEDDTRKYNMVINGCETKGDANDILEKILHKYPKLDKAQWNLLKYKIHGDDTIDSRYLTKSLKKKLDELDTYTNKLNTLQNTDSKVEKEYKDTENVKSYKFSEKDVQDKVLEQVKNVVTNYYNDIINYYNTVINESLRLIKKYNDAALDEFNELVTKHHYSKVDKLEIMEFKCYKDRYSYFDFKHPDTHIGIDVVKYLSQYEELRIFCDAHAHIDNANKEIKSLNAMLGTEEKRNDYSFYLLKNLLVDIYNKYGKLTDSKYIELNRKGGLDGIFKCEKGNCKVTTVLAGGYNIQKLHFRTLIHDFNH